MSDAYRPITVSQVLSLPYTGTIYTTTRTVADEKLLPALGGTMAAELGTAWSGSIVIESSEQPDGTQKRQTLVHAVIPTEAAQLERNWEWSTCDLGGQKFDSIRRTVITIASAFSSTTPALGSDMPISSGTTGSDYGFTGQGYVLVSRNAVRSGMQLEPVFRVEVREYVRRVTTVAIGIDGLNGKPLRETVTIWHASETVTGTGLTAAVLFSAAQSGNAFWGLQSNGTENSGQQLTAEWYAITTAQVVAGSATTYEGESCISIGDYFSNDEYYWPPVLQFVEFMDWAKREGGADIYPRVVMKREAYRGPCRTEVNRLWKSTPFTIQVVNQMLPNGGHYASPFFSVTLPGCLHETVTFVCDIGNTDPEYSQNSGSARTFLATNHTDWPGSITAYDDQEPYRGGYLRTVRTVHSPLGSGGGAPVVVVPQPANLAFSNITSSGFDLSWTDDPLATKWLVEVSDDPGFSTFFTYEFVTTPTITVSGLEAGTLYDVRVTAYRDPYASAGTTDVVTTLA